MKLLGLPPAPGRPHALLGPQRVARGPRQALRRLPHLAVLCCVHAAAVQAPRAARPTARARPGVCRAAAAARTVGFPKCCLQGVSEGLCVRAVPDAALQAACAAAGAQPFQAGFPVAAGPQRAGGLPREVRELPAIKPLQGACMHDILLEVPAYPNKVTRLNLQAKHPVLLHATQ